MITDERTYCKSHPTRRDFAHTGMCSLCYQRAVDSGKHVADCVRERDERDPSQVEARRSLGEHAVELALELRGRGWSSAEIAELLDATERTVANWVSGRAIPTRNMPRTNVWISIMEDTLNPKRES